MDAGAEAGPAVPSGGSAPRRRTGADLESLAERLKALAHPKRLDLIEFLTQPHYMEEIASRLSVSRQAAQEHVKRLAAAGLLTRLDGRREQTAVTDYTVHPQRLWILIEELARLAHLDTEVDAAEDMRPTTMPMADPTGAPLALPQPRLVVVHGLRIGTSRALAGHGPWLVGRDPHAAIVLDWDPHASNRHFEVRRTDDGYEVADLYSSNGTYLDWARLPRGGAGNVGNGSVLRAGKSLLLFRVPS